MKNAIFILAALPLCLQPLSGCSGNHSSRTSVGNDSARRDYLIRDSIISESITSDSVSQDNAEEFPYVPQAKRGAPAHPSLPFNPAGCPWIEINSKTKETAHIYGYEYLLEGIAGCTDGKGLIIERDGWRYDFLENIPELESYFFDNEGRLSSGTSAQLTLIDYNSDNICEGIVSLSDGRGHAASYVFILRRNDKSRGGTDIFFSGIAHASGRINSEYLKAHDLSKD